MAEVILLGDLIRTDVNNTNRGTERGKAVLKQSLQQDGFGRPMFAAANGELIGGNHTAKSIEELRAEGKEFGEPIYVHSSGDRPIIHIRDDIPSRDDPRAFRLHVNDNRTTQLNFNPDLEAVRVEAESYEIAPEAIGYAVEEMAVVPDTAPMPSGESGGSTQGGAATSGVGESYGVVVRCPDETTQQQVYELLQGIDLPAGVGISLATL